MYIYMCTHVYIHLYTCMSHQECMNTQSARRSSSLRMCESNVILTNFNLHALSGGGLLIFVFNREAELIDYITKC